MTIPTTNVKFSDIAAEFGGTAPHTLSVEYFRGGGLVPAGQATSATDGVAIPTAASTLIRFGMFRGLSGVQNLPASGPGVFNASRSAGGFVAGTASADITFLTNGQVSRIVDGSPVTSYWYQPTTTNIGANYWIRATLTDSITLGSTVTRSGTTGTWLRLNSDRQWAVTVTGLGVYGLSTYTFEFSTSSTGSPIVGTYTNCIIIAEYSDLR